MIAEVVEVSDALRSAVEILIELQRLECAGRAETPEADELRLAMEGPWHQLSQEERERVDGISADLYMLSDEEIFAEVPDEQRQRAWLGPRYAAAREAGDDWHALALLRNGPAYLKRGELAALRGVLYERLGLFELAILFYELSLSEPHHPSSELVHLRLLLELGRTEEALARAKAAAEQQIAELDELVAA